MARLSYHIYCWVTRFRDRVRRRFTRPGLIVFFGVIVTGLLGIDTEQSVSYQAFSILCSLLVVAAAFIPFFAARFTVQRMVPRLASVGDKLSYTVKVRNDTNKVQRAILLQEMITPTEPTYTEYRQWLRSSRRWPSFKLVTRPPTHLRAVTQMTPLPPIAPGQEVEVKVDLMPLRRGRLTLAGCRFARPDPFGLLNAYARTLCSGGILVLPKRYPIPSFSLPGTIKYQQGGVALASSVGESQEYVFLREYRRGDPLRHVHWKSWARLAKPIVKEFQNEFFVRHALILDTFLEEDDEELFEESVSIAASFAFAIQTQESLLDLMFVGPQAYCFTAGRGLAPTEQLLEILAAVSPCRDHSFEVLERLVLGHAPALSACVCVFHRWDAPRQRLIRQLLALSVPCQVLLVRRPTSKEPPPEPLVGPGNLAVLELGRVAKDLAALRESETWSKVSCLQT